jgi:hypothetical protein
LASRRDDDAEHESFELQLFDILGRVPRDRFVRPWRDACADIAGDRARTNREGSAAVGGRFERHREQRAGRAVEVVDNAHDAGAGALRAHDRRERGSALFGRGAA